MTGPITTDAALGEGIAAAVCESAAERLASFHRDVSNRVTAKIMLVDDEATTVKVVRRHLESVGYHNFVTCTEANAAIDVVRQETPDIVLLDVLMPEVDGLEILTQLRDDEDIKMTPVIILTASANPEISRTDAPTSTASWCISTWGPSSSLLPSKQR